MDSLYTTQRRSERRAHVILGVFALVAVLLGAAVARGGLLVAAGLTGIPVVAGVLWALFREPRLGLYAALLATLFGAGLKRYVPAPTGLAVDFLLALTLIALLVRGRNVWDWSRLRNSLFVLLMLWMLYNLFQLVNPEARSFSAWFFAVRAVALYWVVVAPVALVLFDTRRDLNRVLWLWLGVSVLGVLWGFKQLHIGLDPYEWRWLSMPANQSTHLLFGKLRVFSFYSDSGQFGAAQGHAAVVAIILALGSGSRWKRLGLAVVGGLCMYGLFISGTRGAMAVPFVGLFVYFVLSKNWKVLSVGLLVLGTAFFLLRYTYVAHNVYEVRRMRTAFVQGSDNPSLQVRLENQKRLKSYLATRPFGGGVGSVGYWGRRFSPGTFLADFPPDSWFVKIAAEQGPVGLVFYLLMLFWLMARGWLVIRCVRDPGLRHQLLALYASLWGILVSSYGNEVLGQMPTSILFAYSLVFIFAAPRLDKTAEWD